MKCIPYSQITVEIRTQLKTVKITSNIFAVYIALHGKLILPFPRIHLGQQAVHVTYQLKIFLCQFVVGSPITKVQVYVGNSKYLEHPDRNFSPRCDQEDFSQFSYSNWEVKGGIFHSTVCRPQYRNQTVRCQLLFGGVADHGSNTFGNPFKQKFLHNQPSLLSAHSNALPDALLIHQ